MTTRAALERSTRRSGWKAIGGSAFPEVVPAMLNTSPFDQPGDPR